MPIEVTNCSDIAAEDLCAALNLAFSDYLVPLQMDVSAFKDFQVQRGFSAEHSFVARSGNEIAAFWLASTPLKDYGNRCYTLSTGTVPAHRRKGLIKTLFHMVSNACQADGASGLQHEVITTNNGAVAVYKAMGFRRARDLLVYKVPSESLSVSVPDGFEIRALTIGELPVLSDFFEDVQATPQNSRAAVGSQPVTTKLIGAFQRDGTLIGWGAIYQSGAVVQIAVRRDVRRQGVGTAIVIALAKAVDTEVLSFVNVDAEATTLTAFLTALGGEEVLRQYEMRLQF
ncbi:GNAT family N-acetyltransferase [Labrenzia sp. PHM005]|uniref:GNAT family N-acetyltransferase n=1 Tax=Labrenzia sp. PHM005 TaxID=2590016 RepID=UPI001140545F|nr:GNAT family N-acetyltransferase [Labrenzia sp. PHM005]QDG77204.1 GNAT family N-acetyltransferase [Labrenzia sp. PHM005]